MRDTARDTAARISTAVQEIEDAGIISGMILTKCLEYIILLEDCPGKQVRILYEPVAVRHKNIRSLPVVRETAEENRLLT